jgi:hypothetical protein
MREKRGRLLTFFDAARCRNCFSVNTLSLFLFFEAGSTEEEEEETLGRLERGNSSAEKEEEEDEEETLGRLERGNSSAEKEEEEEEEETLGTLEGGNR